jgi:urease accessory protein UreH
VTHAYAEPPFRLGRSFELDGAAYLLLVCSAPGVFGGDVLHQRVTVGPGARVLLASQSALQVHPTASQAPAILHLEYDVADDGELHCVWDPVIPFADARLEQRFDLAIGANGRLYWSDALMSGRASRGECWRFASLAHELRLSVGGATAYLERYHLDRDSDPARRWQCGDAHYVGTAIVRHARATSSVADELHRQLQLVVGARAAVDLLEPGLIVGRLLAAGGPPFAAARARLRTATLGAVFESPQLVMRR